MFIEFHKKNVVPVLPAVIKGHQVEVVKEYKDLGTVFNDVRPGSIDPMTAVVQRVKGFAYYSLSFSRHNKNIKMEHFFLLYILSRYFI